MLAQAQPLPRSLSGVTGEADMVVRPSSAPTAASRMSVPPANNPNTLSSPLLASILTLALCPHRDPLHHPAGGIQHQPAHPGPGGGGP